MDKVHNADLSGPVALRAPWLAGNLLAGSLKIHTTVKCACVGRSSVGLHWPIEYTLTGLISATELITRYYSNEKLAQCCFNVRPSSATLADIKPTFGECAVLAGKALTVNMLEVNCFQTPTVTQPFVPQHTAHMRKMVNYFLIDAAQVYRVYMIWELALNATIGMKHI